MFKPITIPHLIPHPQILSWTPESPVRSLVLVAGQHGNEYAGQEAMGMICRYLLHCATKGDKFGVDDGATADQSRYFDRVSLKDTRVLLVAGMNPTGAALGLRRYVPLSDPTSYGVDLNRTWPDGRLTGPIWGLIEALPGPTLVVDIHSSRWSADHFAYVDDRSKDWVDRMKVLPEGWVTKNQNPISGTLQDEAAARGYLSITLEFSEHDGLLPEAVEAFKRIYCSDFEQC